MERVILLYPSSHLLWQKILSTAYESTWEMYRRYHL